MFLNPPVIAFDKYSLKSIDHFKKHGRNIEGSILLNHRSDPVPKQPGLANCGLSILAQCNRLQTPLPLHLYRYFSRTYSFSEPASFLDTFLFLCKFLGSCSSCHLIFHPRSCHCFLTCRCFLTCSRSPAADLVTFSHSALVLPLVPAVAAGSPT